MSTGMVGYLRKSKWVKNKNFSQACVNGKCNHVGGMTGLMGLGWAGLVPYLFSNMAQAGTQGIQQKVSGAINWHV